MDCYRVIVGIMDNFHFDLSQSTLDVRTAPVPKVEREPDPDTSNTGTLMASIYFQFFFQLLHFFPEKLVHKCHIKHHSIYVKQMLITNEP